MILIAIIEIGMIPLALACSTNLTVNKSLTTDGDDPVEQASYALGYNLAVEYLADPEKTGLLESFRRLSEGLGWEGGGLGL